MINITGAARVVVVDNDQSELDDLVRGMHRAHIPVLPVLYSADVGVVNKPDKSNLNIRILFIDMNLTDSSAPSARDIAPTIAEVISSIVPNDNGPYALIFWSKHVHLVDEVLGILSTRHVDISIPIVTGSLDKNEFKVIDSGSGTVDLEKLHQSIFSIVDKSAQLSALMMWEREISNAAANTLVALSKFCKHDGVWDVDEYAKNLERILSRIAEEATGKKNALLKPEEAIHSGLQPLLVDNLERDFSVPDGRKLWTRAMPSLKLAPAAVPVYRELNTFYSISQNTAHMSKTDRGAFIQIPPALCTDSYFLKTFGKGKGELAEEFMSVNGLLKPAIAEARASIKWGLIEISADCDYAQKKSRLFRYILAAAIPNQNPKRTEFLDSSGRTSDRKHNAIYRFPEVILAGGEVTVIFANYRYLLGLTEKDPLLGEILLRIRGPILGELLYNYSRYVARPGVISFSH